MSKSLKTAYLFLTTLFAIFLSFLKRPGHSKYTKISERPPKILLFGYIGLGDALMLQPSLRALLAAFPQSRIDLVAGSESQSRPMLERLMSMENRSFGTVLEADYKALSLAELRRFNRTLLEQHYDIAICTYMSPSPYFIKAINSASIRVGHSLPWPKWYKPRPNRIFNTSIRLAQNHEHETSRHARLIGQLINKSVEIAPPAINLTEAEKQFADTFWKKNELQGRIVIGTHFGASKGQNWKKWDDDRFAEVLRELQRLYNPVFLHYGLATEEAQIQEASKFVKSSSIVLAGKISLFEVAALLSKCDAMLANDSGLGHIAMAIGTKSLRIFGMSDYWGYRTLSEKHVDIFKDIPCSPCLQLGYLKPYNVHNCGHKNCLKLITAEEVVAGFGRLMRGVEPQRISNG